MILRWSSTWRQNDSDVDGDPLSIVSAGGASRGQVEVIDAHRVTFPDCNGSDQFTYQVTDGEVVIQSPPRCSWRSCP